jgi:amino-acid N-acetyltransferase
MEIRPASPQDWTAIKSLIKANKNTLAQTDLPRSREFFVAVEDGKIVGCCALAAYGKRFAEIRSLAVSQGFEHRGIGEKLIIACTKRAEEKEIKELLAITYPRQEGYFGRFGFSSSREGGKVALLRSLRKKN